MNEATTESAAKQPSISRPAAVGVLSFLLWISAEIGNALFASSRNDNGDEQQPSYKVSMAIRIIFPCNVAFSLLSIWFLKRSGRSNGDLAEFKSTRDNRDVWWIFLPSLSLFFILTLRLIVGINHFQTYPPNLDFGPKYGLVYSDTGLPVETNIAFDPELNTVTHCVQGILAAFLAYLSAILVQRDHPTCRWKLLVSLAASALTIYPVYNLIKRITAKDPETFATSSFSNNAMEWALGFVGGMAMGQCLQTYCMTRASSSASESSVTKSNLLPDGDENDQVKTQNEGMMSRAVSILKALFGALLILSVFAAAILYGYSWNNCEEIEEDNVECILDPSKGLSIPVIACFVAIPVCFNAVMCCWLRRR
jgi:hypothetical protein